jgi:hypothetical protein
MVRTSLVPGSSLEQRPRLSYPPGSGDIKQGKHAEDMLYSHTAAGSDTVTMDMLYCHPSAGSETVTMDMLYSHTSAGSETLTCGQSEQYASFSGTELARSSNTREENRDKPDLTLKNNTDFNVKQEPFDYIPPESYGSPVSPARDDQMFLQSDHQFLLGDSPGARRFLCNLCDKQFKSKAHLQRHLVVHSGEKACKCYICGFACNRKENLKQHLLLHSIGNPHQCHLCSKSFTHRSQLRTHLQTHVDSGV